MSKSKTEVTSAVTYRADLSGPEDGPTGIRLWRETIHHVMDGAGRRRWSKESELNSNEPRETVAELSMSQAVRLFTELAEAIGWMAKDHPGCKGESNAHVQD